VPSVYSIIAYLDCQELLTDPFQSTAGSPRVSVTCGQEGRCGRNRFEQTAAKGDARRDAEDDGEGSLPVHSATQ
jgi:hypothetical protein